MPDASPDEGGLMIPIRVKFALAASLLAGLCGPWLTITPAFAQTATRTLTTTSSTTTTTTDTTPPTIIKTDPADGAVEVSTLTSISFGFSEAIDSSTLSVLVYYINPDRTRTLIPGTVTYDSSVGTFSPTDPLSSGILHYVSAADRDAAGNLGYKTWSFTTVSLVTTDALTRTLTTETDCTDKIDNDRDGLIDCADATDCSADAACATKTFLTTETSDTSTRPPPTDSRSIGETTEEVKIGKIAEPTVTEPTTTTESSDSTSEEGTARTDVTVVEETVEESTDGTTEETAVSLPNLGLEIEADSNVAWVGEEVYVTIVVSNNGDSPADGVVVTADIAGDVSAATSALVSFITKPADCTGDPAIICHLESIAAGEKVVLNFTLSPNEAGLQVITFLVESSEEGDPSDNIVQMMLQVSAEEGNDTEVVGETELAFSAFGGGGCRLAVPETGESASFASLYLVLLASAFLFTLKIRKSSV